VDKITQAINRLFEKYRIVFWYDAKKDLMSDFEAVSIADVKKIKLKRNEYGLKHHMLREAPLQKFLLYHEGPAPPDLENWLLDIQLSHGEFRADRISLLLAELGLGPEFWNLVQEHEAFFAAKSRTESLKQALDRGDSHSSIRAKMLAICDGSGADSSLEGALKALLQELADENEEKINLIGRCGLDRFLWGQLEGRFGYSSATPGVRDFVIELFKSAYASSLQEDASLTNDALVFLNSWKDSQRYKGSFEALSHEAASIIGVEADIQTRDLADLIEIDYFRLVDQKILSELVISVVDRIVPANEVDLIMWHRRNTHWYAEFSHVYDAIQFASDFLAAAEASDFSIGSLVDGLRKYASTWYRLDRLYRKFIFHARKSKQTSLLEPLIDRVENWYSNHYLLEVNDHWQLIIDGTQTWEAPPVHSQREFFETRVDEFLRSNTKVAVIISDALRYEAASELNERILGEDRFSSDLDFMLGALPSYTQLGMAVLLPRQEMGIAIESDGSVNLGGQSTAGTENRGKLLSDAISEGCSALRAKDFLQMTRDTARALIHENQVLYIYHNQIDAVGDKRDTEERVFNAVEAALDELVDIIKKLTNANLSNILVTADHGFIYQDRVLDESEFAGNEVEADEILYRDRRFVIGHGIRPSASIKRFSASDLGLAGNYEIGIPKSINRLRLSGAGSRYVHGGASLQEVVLPVVKVNKKRTSDVDKVEVDIIRSASSVITSGQLAVAMYQVEPVSAKGKARRLRAGIYTQENELISDYHEITFDLASEDGREREIPVQFVLTRKADEVNNQDVFLRLEDPVEGTSHYREYKSVRYLIRRSFTTDFDL